MLFIFGQRILAILLLSSTIVMAVSNPMLPSAAYAITFGATKNLSNNIGNSFIPLIESSGNNVYVVWSDLSEGDVDTFFKRSSTSGGSFQNTKDLSNGIVGDAQEQGIAKEGNNVYVVWSEDGDVYFKRSTNSGASFGSTINLSNDDNISDRPEIAVAGDNVYVVWVSSLPDEDSDQLFFKRSTSNGASFGSLKKIDISNEDLDPKIAASGNIVYIVASQGKQGVLTLRFTKSTNKGSSFSEPISLGGEGRDARLGDIAAKGSNVYIVWQDTQSGVTHAFFKRSTDNGKSFGSIKDFGPGFSTQLDTISNNVYIVWTNGDNDIAFRASTNNGASFGSTKILSNEGDADNLQNPQISSAGNAVRIVWEDLSGNEDIFFRASGNEGNSFGSIKNLSNNEANSFGPQIISSGNNVYVVWSDDTPGNFDIFFKKGVD